MGRLAPVDHDGGHAGAGGRLECRLPALVDLDQVEQRAHHAVHPAQELAASGPLQVAQGALERLGPGRAAVARLLALVGHPLRRLRPLGRPVERGPARRDRRPPAGPWSSSSAADSLSSRSALTAAAAWRCSSAASRASRAVMSCCSRATARARGSRARPHLGQGVLGQVVPEHVGPALPERRLLGVEHAGLGLQLGLRRVRRRLVGRQRDLGGQVRRLGLEGGDHVDVGRRIERGHHGAAPLAQHARGPPGPLDQSLHPAERPGQVLLAVRGELGRGGRGLGVEHLEGGVELALLLAADGQALGWRRVRRLDSSASSVPAR